MQKKRLIFKRFPDFQNSFGVQSTILPKQKFA